jgi:intracellular sulfur oxidation DsrE/DsrF family protein
VRAIAILIVILTAPVLGLAQWPAPQAPAIPDADGYVIIPQAAVPPDKAHVYKAIFDATRAANKPTELLPALNMVGSEFNALGAAGVPLQNAKFAIVFHGPAINGILDNAHYREKFGASNSNLRVLSQLKKSGAEIFVCGQNLAAEKIDPKSLSPDVEIASDALIVLMTYQNNGYSLLNF